MEKLSNIYLAIGAGGISVITVIGLLIFMIKNLYPLMSSMKEDNSAYKEIIKNNTQAVREVSKSNDNVATALKLLDNSFSNLAKIMEQHDLRASNMENSMIRIDEKINALKESK